MATATKSASAAPVRRARFDVAGRERIRAALLAYMEAHRIGVPALQVRIAENTDRSQDLIPLKTLQRFLAGTHRTNDAFLIPCHQFASSLPDYGRPEEARTDSLVHALGGFFFMPEAAAVAPAVPPLQGEYGVYTDYSNPEFRGPRMFRPEDAVLVHYGRVTLKAGPQDRCRLVEEEVVNPARKNPFTPGVDQPRHRYDGVLVQFETAVFALLRNVLTRLPKSYGLKRDGQRLMGSSFEPPFAVDTESFRYPHVVFTPDEQKPLRS